MLVKKVLLVVVVGSTISGCVSIDKQAMPLATVTALKGQPVAQTRRAVPDFVAGSAGKAAFALIGYAMMVSDGNALVAKYKLADPADALAASLAAALESGRGAKMAEQPIAVNTTNVDEISAAAAGTARFVIDVQTVDWGFAYFPSDWTHYSVKYFGKAKLIDSATKTTVAEGFCKALPQAKADAPTYDELVANDALVLKQQLAIAAQECAKTLKAEMFSL
jgi:hypothetical protein